MALMIGKNRGGVLNVTSADGTGSTNLVLPESGTVIAADASGNVTLASSTAPVLFLDIISSNPLSNIRLGQLVYGGSGGAAASRISGYTDGNWTDGISTPSSLRFLTTASGSISVVERMRIDSNGNVGIGVTPNAWTITPAFQINGASILSEGDNLYFTANAFYGASAWTYKASNYASQYYQNIGSHVWRTAPSGTAGNAIAWTNAMMLDANGKLSIGASGAATKLSVDGNNLESCFMEVVNAFNVQVPNSQAYSSASATATVIRIGKMTSGRSINAVGTINASGADYAEYEYSNDITIEKGQIVGFKSDGTLTDKYSESIRFAIKSTNPSIVGGDTWGVESILGEKPRPVTKTEEMTDEEFAALEEQYKLDLADFEARLEAERQKVDRIAYAGKVPVNVLGAKAGDYIIVVNKDDKIDGEAISNPTFEQYLKCVGRVNKILEDGRAEVAVIIH